MSIRFPLYYPLTVTVIVFVLLGTSTHGVTATSYLLTPSDSTWCCTNSTDNSTCIYCTKNVTLCCANQPHTWQQTGHTAFCCLVGQECCGLGGCCSADEVCCSGSNSHGSCCQSSECNSDGTCGSSSQPLSKNWIILAVGLLVMVGACIGVCWKLSFRRQNRAQHVAQPQQGGYYQAQHLNVNSQPQIYAISSEDFYPTGIPDHYLENFPVYEYGITEKPILSRSPPKISHMKDDKSKLIVDDDMQKQPLLTTGENPERVCCICLDNFVQGERLRLLPCMHSFHVNCIDMWLNKHTTCPLCKLDLITLEFTD